MANLTKAQLIEQNTALRMENSTLRTQLAAVVDITIRTTLSTQDAIKRLKTRFPTRKSFTLAEVTAEAKN